MKKDDFEVDDEMLACFLEGKLAGDEKRAVEAYLADHSETMEALMLARYELGLRSVKRRFYLHSIIALVLIVVLSLLAWRLLTPIQMKVNVTEDATFAIPRLPFESGVLQCEYAGNALQRITITNENRTVFLNDIPYLNKRHPVHLVFESAGYQTIDTILKAQKSVELHIRRNNDLGVVFGRVCDIETCQPVEGATVSLLEFSTTTDTLGQFRIEIPFAKQDESQRVLVTKKGYLTWDAMYRPSATEPWLISMEKGERP
ncbi:MAG: carboxypeptidase-like regulatory domain-containing protein [Bacteroidales bacterium]|nr:carboxypeptidase-like regulatory domain-containing protein [Bacteroidales bacterium]